MSAETLAAYLAALEKLHALESAGPGHAAEEFDTLDAMYDLWLRMTGPERREAGRHSEELWRLFDGTERARRWPEGGDFRGAD